MNEKRNTAGGWRRLLLALAIVVNIALMGWLVYAYLTLAGLVSGTSSPGPAKEQTAEQAAESKVEEPRLARTLEKNTSGAFCLAFSPDSKILASSGDDTIKLWDMETGNNTATLTGHTKVVWSLVFSPDGKLLASGSEDGTMKLWNVKTGKDITTSKGTAGQVQSVAFSPDGKQLAWWAQDDTIKLWDVEERKIAAALKDRDVAASRHRAVVRVLAVAFRPDGLVLASGTQDGTIRLWDVKTGKQTATLKGHTDRITSVAYSPDGRVLASGCYDKTIKLWDAKTGENTRTIPTGHGHTFSIAFHPDGKLLASGSLDGTIRLWDVKTRKRPAVLSVDQSVWAVAFSPNGRFLATASQIWPRHKGDQSFGFIRLWALPGSEKTDR